MPFWGRKCQHFSFQMPPRVMLGCPMTKNRNCGPTLKNKLKNTHTKCSSLIPSKVIRRHPVTKNLQFLWAKNVKKTAKELKKSYFNFFWFQMPEKFIWGCTMIKIFIFCVPKTEKKQNFGLSCFVPNTPNHYWVGVQ